MNQSRYSSDPGCAGLDLKLPSSQNQEEKISVVSYLEYAVLLLQFTRQPQRVIALFLFHFIIKF